MRFSSIHKQVSAPEGDDENDMNSSVTTEGPTADTSIFPTYDVSERDMLFMIGFAFPLSLC